MSGFGYVGQSSSQPRAIVQGFGQSDVRPTIVLKSKAGSSSRA